MRLRPLVLMGLLTSVPLVSISYGFIFYTLWLLPSQKIDIPIHMNVILGLGIATSAFAFAVHIPTLSIIKEYAFTFISGIVWLSTSYSKVFAFAYTTSLVFLIFVDAASRSNLLKYDVSRPSWWFSRSAFWGNVMCVSAFLDLQTKMRVFVWIVPFVTSLGETIGMIAYSVKASYAFGFRSIDFCIYACLKMATVLFASQASHLLTI